MAKARKFPKEIFVKREDTGDRDGSTYLSASESAEEACEADEVEIATYALVNVRKGKLIAQIR